ncbi:hypothetical protein AJ78_08849 [Emergomyces pasteurianus Ep9510]|uniref:Uncharacterized protein n=1 Tax=Emergomyces pasteurianus Ep9510 TaxID=1447872 RepID=A0A1J9P0R5_9EURO|nr:hypothetical protein AJ78_08849 [Emergomyces pasteurianus Ep9510]
MAIYGLSPGPVASRLNVTSNATLNVTLNATSNAELNVTLNAELNVTPNATLNATSNAELNATLNATSNVTPNAELNATLNATLNEISISRQVTSYSIYMNNYFISVSLFKELHQQEYEACRITRPNQVPAILSEL